MASLAANIVPMGAGYPDLGRPVDRDAMFRLCTLLAVSRCLYPLWPCVDSAPAVPASGDAALRLWSFLHTADAGKFLGYAPPAPAGASGEFRLSDFSRLQREYLNPVVRAADGMSPDLQWQVRGACRYRVWWELFNRAMQQLVDAPGMVPLRTNASGTGSSYALAKCRGRSAVPLDETGLLTDGWIDDLTYGTALSQVTCCRNDYDQTRVAPAQGASPIGSPILPTLADEWVESFLGYRLLPSGTPGVLRAMWRSLCSGVGLDGWLPDDWDSRKAADGAQYADMVRRVGGVRRAPWRGDAEPSFSWHGGGNYSTDYYLTQLLSPWTGRGTTPTDPAAPPAPVEWDSDFPYHGLCALESLLEHMEMDAEGLVMYSMMNLWGHDSEGYGHDAPVYTDTTETVDFAGSYVVTVNVLPPGSTSSNVVADVPLSSVRSSASGEYRTTSARPYGWTRVAGGGAGETEWVPAEGPHAQKTLELPPSTVSGSTVTYDITSLDPDSKAFWRAFLGDPGFGADAGTVFLDQCDAFLGIDVATTWDVRVRPTARIAVTCRGSSVRLDRQWCRSDVPLSSAVRSRTGLLQSMRHVFFLKSAHGEAEPSALDTAISTAVGSYGPDAGDADMESRIVNGAHVRIFSPTAQDEAAAVESAWSDAADEAVRRSAAALKAFGYVDPAVGDPDAQTNVFFVRNTGIVEPTDVRVSVSHAVWARTYPELVVGTVSGFVCVDGATSFTGTGPQLAIGSWGPGSQQGSAVVSASATRPPASVVGYVADVTDSGGGTTSQFYAENAFYGMFGYSVPVYAGDRDNEPPGVFASVARFTPGRIS